MNTLGLVFNSMHMFFVFFPFIIFALPKLWLKDSYKYIMLIYLLTPLQWIYFEDKCVFTILTYKYGNNLKQLKQSGEHISFSEKYLKWFYKPFMDMIGWEWSKDLDKIIYLHWIIIFICLWYYAFFINI